MKIILLFLLFYGIILADGDKSYEKARMYLGLNGESADYIKAFKYMKKASKQSCVQAIAELGDMYFNGIGTDRNLDSAMSSYKLAAFLQDGQSMLKVAKLSANPAEKSQYYIAAAKNGISEAIDTVGFMYLNGTYNTPVDTGQAMKYLAVSVTNDNKNAAEALGEVLYARQAYRESDSYLKLSESSQAYFIRGEMAYMQGRYSDAIALYTRAYIQPAYQKLAMMYFKGIGVIPDYTKALIYCEKLDNLNPETALIRGYSILKSKEWNAQTVQEAYYFYTIADNHKNPDAKAYIAMLRKELSDNSVEASSINESVYKTSIPLDSVDPVKYARESADNGSAYGYYVLGEFAWYGNFMTENLRAAVDYYQKAAERNSPEALYALGELYSRSDDLPSSQGFQHDYGYDERQDIESNYLKLRKIVVQDSMKAISYMQKAASLQYAKAHSWLASTYFYADKYDSALVWLRKLAEQNDPKGLFLISSMFYGGMGIVANDDSCKYYMAKSARLHYDPAVVLAARNVVRGDSGLADSSLVRELVPYIEAKSKEDFIVCNAGSENTAVDAYRYFMTIFYNNSFGVNADSVKEKENMFRLLDTVGSKTAYSQYCFWILATVMDDTPQDIMESALRQVNLAAIDGLPEANAQMAQVSYFTSREDDATRYAEEAASKGLGSGFLILSKLEAGGEEESKLNALLGMRLSEAPSDGDENELYDNAKEIVDNLSTEEMSRLTPEVNKVLTQIRVNRASSWFEASVNEYTNQTYYY